MRMIKLQDIASIDISNVDKKVKDGEKEVILCNFVDVYHNWAITSNLVPTLMRATANENQIQRFAIKKGQVAITKDSETRDDIGIPTYIADSIPDAVLGYHCALITPNESFLIGKYLNVVLHSPYAKKYFEANASGSGQRYTLTTEIIGGFPVPLIDISQQKEIGDIFANLDKRIENNNAICSNLEAMAKLLYDYWFVQFDFPDENGKPYKSSGGKMVWNDELKREIPAGWEVKPLGEVLVLLKDGTHNPPKRVENGIPLLTGTMFGNYFLDYSQATYITRDDYEAIHSQYQPIASDIILTKIGTLGNVNYLKEGDIPLAIHCNSALLRFPDTMAKMFSLAYCKSEEFQKRLRAAKGQSVQEFCSLDSIASIMMLVPAAKIISQYNERTNPILKNMERIDKENQQLASLRDFLLPMLMNGQVKVGKVGA